LLIISVFTNVKAQMVSTIAGSPTISGWVDASGAAARFNGPHGITADKSGNVYIADRLNNRIRKISLSGVVSTVAGSGAVGGVDAQGTAASFNEPWGIACDTLGNLYVADTKNYKIRKIDAAGNVTTVAGVGVFGTTNGTVNVATFGFPTGIAVSKDGSIIYVADYNTHVIRKIFGGMVSTFSGTVYLSGANDGISAVATFNHPRGIELDANNNIIVADEWNNLIRKVSPAGTVVTLAGTGVIGSVDGTAGAALFNYPGDITIDTLNNIFVADGYNNTIRKIASGTNLVTTYAGTAGLNGSADGIGTAARFNGACGIVYNRFNKSLYVADTYNQTLRKITNTSSITIALTVTGNTTVCAGDSIHFVATPGGLTNYTISENGIVLGTSATGSVSIPALPQGAHVLSCSAQDGTGATASSNTVSITVLAPFVPTLTSSNGTTICAGDSVKLTAQAGTNYAWSNGATTAFIYAKAAGTYFVTVTNSNGCKGSSAPLIITINASPVATISAAAPSVCPGSTTTLTASAGSSWKWSTGALTQAITTGAGSYTVTVTNAAGCSNTSAVNTISNYTVIPPVISPDGVVTVLQGDSVLLTATGGNSYNWSNGGAGAGIYVHTNGFYSVVATTANGCTSSSATVQVITITAQTILSAAGATTFCEGGNVLLSSVFPTGNQWYFNGQPLPGEVNQQYSAIDSGYYKVASYQSNHWVFSDSMLVKVYTAPQEPDVTDTAICSSNAVFLQVAAQNGLTYKWYDQYTGGSLLSSQSSYQTPPLQANAHYYIESINGFGCASVVRAGLNVLVMPTPAPAFSTTTQLQTGMYLTTFNNTTVNADIYQWIFGDTTIAGNTSSLQNPVFSYPAVGTYTVTLIATTNVGCTSTLVQKIQVSGNNSLFVPTTFTPNGDGKNDIFRVRGDNITLEEMLIYDQWGKVIYRTDEARPNWDGTVNGETVANGTYVYRIRILDKDQQSKELTGPITVIK
jgi:gliding motility-associated-like protein